MYSQSSKLERMGLSGLLTELRDLKDETEETMMDSQWKAASGCQAQGSALSPQICFAEKDSMLISQLIQPLSFPQENVS